MLLLMFREGHPPPWAWLPPALLQGPGHPPPMAVLQPGSLCQICLLTLHMEIEERLEKG